MSGWNDNAIYVVITMLSIKALAIGTCIGLNIFIGPRIVSAYDKLYEIADLLREWLLVILWLAILTLAVVFIIFTPLMWPIDVPQLLRIYPSGDLFG